MTPQSTLTRGRSLVRRRASSSWRATSLGRGMDHVGRLAKDWDGRDAEMDSEPRDERWL
jgi:hypothetical protein